VCIDPHQTGFVGEGSDHLQLIKFWPSRAPGKGVCGRAKAFGSALLQPARSVCVSLSAFFILFNINFAVSAALAEICHSVINDTFSINIRSAYQSFILYTVYCMFKIILAKRLETTREAESGQVLVQ